MNVEGRSGSSTKGVYVNFYISVCMCEIWIEWGKLPATSSIIVE